MSWKHRYLCRELRRTLRPPGLVPGGAGERTKRRSTDRTTWPLTIITSLCSISQSGVARKGDGPPSSTIRRGGINGGMRALVMTSVVLRRVRNRLRIIIIKGASGISRLFWGTGGNIAPITHATLLFSQSVCLSDSVCLSFRQQFTGCQFLLFSSSCLLVPLGSVQENVCNISKNVKSCFFGFSKKNVKNVKKRNH